MGNKKMQLICIQCPRGCHLTVDSKGVVTGNSCPKGEEYAQTEMLHPMRMVTTTVKVNSQIHSQLPVITSKCIPKEKVMDVMKALKDVSVQIPIHYQDIIVRNVCNLGVDIVASRDLLR